MPYSEPTHATSGIQVENSTEILLKVLPKIAHHQGEPPFAGSLQYAIISDRSTIPEQRKQDLKAIIGQYIQ